MTTAWPDLIIGGIAIFFAFRGFRNGFVAELAGGVAFFIAVIAGFRYEGSFDATVTSLTGLGAGSAHVVGLIAFSVLWYAIVLLASWLAGRLAKLPVFNLINGILGAFVGVGKTLVVAGFVLYIGLFFPLTPDLRGDLHRSALVQLVTEPDPQIDDTVRSWLPWFMKPLTAPFFNRHHA